MPRKPGPPEDNEKKRAKAAKKTTAFDIWLDRGLHQLYDGVTQEPVPPELLRLIEEDLSKS